MNQLNNFFSYWIGEDWEDWFLQMALIGFGVSCLVFLFTALVCSLI